MNKHIHTIRHLAKYLLALVLVVVPLFSHLDTLPLRLWDESRLAINAYEMFTNHHYVVTYFEGQPDLWNTKPPLLIWMQVFWMKLIGVNELSLRLPSVFAGLFTLVVLVVFCVKYLKNFWFGLTTVLILITSFGYLFNHSIRTANYDGLLTLFTTLSALLFFSFIHTKNRHFLYGFFLTTALAVLTKSINGVLFVPAIALYALLTKQAWEILKNRHFYIGLALFIVLVGGYYTTREWVSPGYLKAVYQNELGGRYLETLENNTSGFWYYYDQLIATHFSSWYLFVPIGILTGYFHKNERIRSLAIYSSLLIGFFFLVISNSQTKLSWYDIPLYPFLAILVAIFIDYIFQILRETPIISAKLRYNIVPFAFLFLLFYAPYQKTLDTIMDPKQAPEDETFYRMGYYFKDVLKGVETVDGFLYINNEYMPNNEFYMHMLRDRGVQIANGGDYKEIQLGSKVIAYQEIIFEYIETHYDFDILQTRNGIKKYAINGRK